MRLLTCLICALSFSVLAEDGAAAKSDVQPEIELGEPLMRVSAEEVRIQNQAECERIFESSMPGLFVAACELFKRDNTPISKTLSASIKPMRAYVCLLPMVCERGLHPDPAKLRAAQPDDTEILAVAFTHRHSWDNAHEILFSDGNCVRIDDPQVFKEHLTDALRACHISLELDTVATPDEQREMLAALADLNDDELDLRVHAYTKLRACGAKAAPLLSLGARSASAEQRVHCEQLLAVLKQSAPHRIEIADIRAELGLKPLEAASAPIVIPTPIKIADGKVAVGELELSMAEIQRTLPAVYSGLKSR